MKLFKKFSGITKALTLLILPALLLTSCQNGRDISSPSLPAVTREQAKKLYEEFIFTAGELDFPRQIELNGYNGPWIRFAFNRYEQGYQGKTLSDFTIYLEDGPIVLYEAPAEDIINCLNAYWDGIDSEAIVKDSSLYDTETDICRQPTGLGGGFLPYVVGDILNEASSDIVTITAYHFTSGLPNDIEISDEALLKLVDSEEVFYDTALLKLQLFADGHWQYKNYQYIYRTEKGGCAETQPPSTETNINLLG